MTPLDTTTEETLVQQLCDRQEQAARLFYSLYAGELSAVAARYVGRGEALKDVMQNAMISVMTRIDTFSYRGKGSLKAWAGRIVTNEALMWLRKTGKMHCVELPSNAEELPDIQEELLVNDVPAEVLQTFIEELPEGFRTVFNLYVFDNYSHKDIARMLGISEGTSASQLHRAKKALAVKIKNYMNRHA